VRTHNKEERKAYKEFIYKTFCCIHPPGDGSTCAGGNCCCTEDYVCDKCRLKKVEACTAIGDEYGNKLYNPNCGCSDCVEHFKKYEEKEVKLCCSPEGEPCVGEEGNK
jgi:hypothetical protein